MRPTENIEIKPIFAITYRNVTSYNMSAKVVRATFTSNTTHRSRGTKVALAHIDNEIYVQKRHGLTYVGTTYIYILPVLRR